MSKYSFMFIAGEPSGDQNTAPVIQRLYQEIPQCRCYGIGGPKMQTAGFESFLPFEEFNRMGYFEVITHLFFFIKAKNIVINEMKKRQPNVLVCVDYSGFNTIIMKAAYRLKIPVIWYIVPKIWAWKKRKHTSNLSKYATHIASIFPFEVKLFQPYTSAISFVGNPLVEQLDKNGYNNRKKTGSDLRNYDKIQLAIVPGSRIQEIRFILPTMIQAFQQLKNKYPNLCAQVSKYSGIDSKEYKKCFGKVKIDCFQGPLDSLLAQSDLAMVTSGTATLQAAMHKIPMVIVYKTSVITYFFIILFIRSLKYIGLPNILANDSIVPELIQNNMKADSLVRAVGKYIENPLVYNRTKQALSALKKELGGKITSLELLKIIKTMAHVK